MDVEVREKEEKRSSHRATTPRGNITPRLVRHNEIPLKDPGELHRGMVAVLGSSPSSYVYDEGAFGGIMAGTLERPSPFVST